jgi:hypothetical protein
MQARTAECFLSGVVNLSFSPSLRTHKLPIPLGLHGSDAPIVNLPYRLAPAYGAGWGGGSELTYRVTAHLTSLPSCRTTFRAPCRCFLSLV